MSLEAWLSLAMLCTVGAMTPGPSLAVVLGSTLRGGRTAGLAAALAHGLAVGLYALLTIAGLATLLTASTTLFALLQLAAAGYLAHLAWQAWQPPFGPPMRDGAAPSEHKTRPGTTERGLAAARDGFMIAFLNPKLALFMLALFAPFISADQGLMTKALLVMTIGGIDAIWYSTVVLLIVQAGLMSTLEQHAARIERLYALLLLLLSVTLAVRALSTFA